MPRNTTVSVASATWTQITDADVTAITFQNLSDFSMFVKATTDTTAPTDLTGALKYAPGQGERAVAMADLFPGLTGADRVWVYADPGVQVFVSHA